MPCATEIALFPLKEGKYPDDPNSLPGQVLKDTFDTLTAQEGFQKAYWGREVENPGNFRLFVDWDSVEAHTKFTKTETYKPFLDRFGQIAHLDQGKLYHTHYTPNPADKVLSDHVSPATEILVIYFPADYSDSDQSTVEENVKKLFEIIAKETNTFTASACGWIVEELTIPGTEEKAKAFSALLGWHSVEAHLAFRETQAFRDNIHLLRGAKDLKKLEVVHYHGTQINKV